ncbi:MAG: T9SS type A sorting domain-containing protein [Saprospiraceae bacterium]|nr:T9SS type A sorting domain-containing protein [Saprospiraceae bacterium]MBK7810820.1 T9SS type A sorting domain-containing protein [Saprospiraceae bacterium]
MQTGYGQNTTLSSGATASGTGGTSDYSVGQVFYTTATGPNGASNQGVQQPYQVTTSVGDELDQVKLVMKVYPNPTMSGLVLIIDPNSNSSIKGMNLQIYDINGKRLFSEKILKYETPINMESLVASYYILNVYQASKLIKSFKILKN